MKKMSQNQYFKNKVPAQINMINQYQRQLLEPFLYFQMKQNLKTSNIKTLFQEHSAIAKPFMNTIHGNNCSTALNFLPPQQEDLVFSEISSVARRQDFSMSQYSQFTQRQQSEQDSSPNFTVNSSLFGQSIQQSCQASQLSSNISELSNMGNQNQDEIISDPCLQFGPSKLIKEYKRQIQLKKLQQKQKQSAKKKQYDQSKLKTIELRNRLRSLKKWMNDGKVQKNKKCSHFKKTEVFTNLTTIKKKENQEKKRKKQHIQYLKQHPPSKLAYYKQLVNQEGIPYQQAKILVDTLFPYLQKQKEDLILNRSITNQQITKNGLQLLKKIRQGNLTKKTLKSENIEMFIFGNCQEKQQKILFQGIQCFAPRQNIKQEESSSEQNDNEKRLRKFRKIYSQEKPYDSKAKETNNEDQLNQRQIYPKRTTKSFLQDAFQDDLKIITKKVKLSQNYYCTSGMDSESDTRTTPWSKNEFKSLSKLNSQTNLQPISEVDHSVQESMREI